MEAHDWLRAIEVEGAAVASVEEQFLDRPVPTCPGWTVADLFDHLTRVHRWATRKIAGNVSQSEKSRLSPERSQPDGLSPSQRYQVALDGLLSELRLHNPDTPADTFVGERTVAFWYRRQAHEIAMHRYDFDTATRPGRERPIERELAADGIDEWLGLFVPRFLELGPGGPHELHGAALGIAVTDLGDTAWTMRLTGAGPDIRPGIDDDASLIRGSASDMLLTVWHRRPPPDGSGAARILDLIHVT